ncbi:hypothetical protein GCM10010420_56620 [Streptomyces glaucosporus]|uniref:Uncharacterized protein n=1 Tax=Streptomyces glaucosporus TaxID=284044 RepID=A0ABP5W6Q6_9ACTN
MRRPSQLRPLTAESEREGGNGEHGGAVRGRSAVRRGRPRRAAGTAGALLVPAAPVVALADGPGGGVPGAAGAVRPPDGPSSGAVPAVPHARRGRGGARRAANGTAGRPSAAPFSPRGAFRG